MDSMGQQDVEDSLSSKVLLAFSGLVWPRMASNQGGRSLRHLNISLPETPISGGLSHRSLPRPVPVPVQPDRWFRMSRSG